MANDARSNALKQEHYRFHKEKYTKAMKAGCYLECVFIDYAMMEDRLLSILSHVGLASREDERNPRWVRKPEAKNAAKKHIMASMMNKNGALPTLKHIGTKLSAVERICDQGIQPDEGASEYELWLCEEVRECLNGCGATQLCEDIRKWKDDRNNLVHSLFCGHHYDYNDEAMKELAERGMSYAQALDSTARKIKRLESARVKRIANSKREAGANKKRQGKPKDK